MSVESLTIALHHSKAQGTARVVLLGIANHDGDGGAWPSIATLARYANVSPRNVQRAIDQLIALKEIRRDLNAGGTPTTQATRRPNLYHFLLSCPSYCDRSRQHRDTRSSARYLPEFLDVEDGVADSSPPGEIATGPLADSSPHPLADSSPEPVLGTGHEPSPSLDSNAGAPAVLRPACPKHAFLPCSYNAEGVCIDCGRAAEEVAA